MFRIGDIVKVIEVADEDYNTNLEIGMRGIVTEIDDEEEITTVDFKGLLVMKSGYTKINEKGYVLYTSQLELVSNSASELKRKAELTNASRLTKGILDALMEEGFTREEAMDIIKIGMRGAM